MGFLSAITGKIYRLNSLNTPIDNHLAQNIDKLEDSSEKLIIATAFEIAQKTIQDIFHPDSGILKDYIDNLNEERLKNIYNIIIGFVIQHTLDSKLQFDREKLETETGQILELGSSIKVVLIFTSGTNQDEKFFKLWDLVSRQASVDLSEDTFVNLSNTFTSIFNEKYTWLKRNI